VRGQRRHVERELARQVEYRLPNGADMCLPRVEYGGAVERFSAFLRELDLGQLGLAVFNRCWVVSSSRQPCGLMSYSARYVDLFRTTRAAKTTKGPDYPASSCLILPETF
jgi:hypothetical protein